MAAAIPSRTIEEQKIQRPGEALPSALIKYVLEDYIPLESILARGSEAEIKDFWNKTCGNNPPRLRERKISLEPTTVESKGELYTRYICGKTPLLDPIPSSDEPYALPCCLPLQISSPSDFEKLLRELYRLPFKVIVNLDRVSSSTYFPESFASLLRSFRENPDITTILIVDDKTYLPLAYYRKNTDIVGNNIFELTYPEGKNEFEWAALEIASDDYADEDIYEVSGLDLQEAKELSRLISKYGRNMQVVPSAPSELGGRRSYELARK